MAEHPAQGPGCIRACTCPFNSAPPHSAANGTRKPPQKPNRTPVARRPRAHGTLCIALLRSRARPPSHRNCTQSLAAHHPASHSPPPTRVPTALQDSKQGARNTRCAARRRGHAQAAQQHAGRTTERRAQHAPHGTRQTTTPTASPRRNKKNGRRTQHQRMSGNNRHLHGRAKLPHTCRAGAGPLRA